MFRSSPIWHVALWSAGSPQTQMLGLSPCPAKLPRHWSTFIQSTRSGHRVFRVFYPTHLHLIGTVSGLPPSNPLTVDRTPDSQGCRLGLGFWCGWDFGLVYPTSTPIRMLPLLPHNTLRCCTYDHDWSMLLVC